MTRQQIKSIVKECLLEILREGIDVRNSQSVPMQNLPNRQQVVVDSYKQRNQPTTLENKRRINPLDMPATPYNQRKNNSRMSEIIKAEARGNPIMASILADTATTTLPKMISSGDSTTLTESNRPNHAISQQEQFSGSPEQIFGEEIASKWADLAFTNFQQRK